MSDTVNAIHQLQLAAARVNTDGASFTRDHRDQLPLSQQGQPKDPVDPVYDFEHLGLKIAESMVLMAEAQLAEATALLDQTKAFAESIRSQVKVQTEALAGLNSRLKTFGLNMMDAHRKFNGVKDD